MLYHKSEKLTMLMTEKLNMIGVLATYFAMVHLTTHTAHKKNNKHDLLKMQFQNYENDSYLLHYISK